MAMFGALVPFADASRRRRRASERRSRRGAEDVPLPRRVSRRTALRLGRRPARFSATLLKRASTRTRRFKVIGTQGGGIGDCAEWRKLAPRAVLKDLRISGLKDSSGAAGNCG